MKKIRLLLFVILSFSNISAYNRKAHIQLKNKVENTESSIQQTQDIPQPGFFSDLKDFFESLAHMFSNSYYSECTVSSLKPVDLSLKYNEVCFLCSNNAFFSYGHGYFPFANQHWSMKKQLKKGVRAFKLELWTTGKKTNLECTRRQAESDEDFAKRAEVRLSFGPTNISSVLLQPLETMKILNKLAPTWWQVGSESLFLMMRKITTMKFEKALDVINHFLNKNKNANEVLTIFLNNQSDNGLIDIVLENAKISDLILKPSDWDPDKKNGWPKLKWMIENKKRVVIFNNFDQTKYTFNKYDYVIENKGSEVDLDKACLENSLSQKVEKNRYLFNVNLFPASPLPKTFEGAKLFIREFCASNDYYLLNWFGLGGLLARIYTNGLDGNGKLDQRCPNFITLNYVNLGDAMAFVNTINDASVANKKRATTIFRSSEKKSRQFVLGNVFNFFREKDVGQYKIFFPVVGYKECENVFELGK